MQQSQSLAKLLEAQPSQTGIIAQLPITHEHRDGKRFIVRADEKLTAFLELEAAIRR
jgi:hypothetical protein